MLQHTQIWIIVLSLCAITNAVTDISLMNCPSQYNLTQANQTVNGTQDIVNLVYSGLASPEDAERIQNIILTGDYDDLSAFLSEKLITFIIIGAVFFGIFFMIIFYCLFDKNWPPCQRFRRDPLTEPYTVKERRCMVVWLLLFSAAILSIGIISFTSIPNMKEYVDYTKCSMYNMLDLTMNGDKNTGWGGMVDLKDKIGNISSLLDSASTQVGTYFTNDEWLINDMTVMKNINLQIYSQNKDSQLITPNPTTTQTNLDNGLDYPMIDSVFIKTGMGPNGTFGTMVDDIDRGLRITEVKSRQAYSIYKSANKMVEASAAIQVNSIAAQNTLSMYIRQLQVLNQEMDAFSVQYFDNSFSTFAYILQGVIGFVVVSSMLILLGAASTHCYDILECRFMVNCGWFIYGLMYAGVLALAFITLSHGTVAYQFCQYLNQSITNETSYAKIGEKYSQNAFNRLDVCILGDGDSLSKFNIAEEMKSVTEIFTNTQTYYDYDNPSSVNYIDLEISISRLAGWISAIEKYRLGVYVDSRAEETNDDNPNYAIKMLNVFSNPSAGGPSKDKWVFDSENCTDPNQVTYVATSSDSNAMALSTTQVICISFNEKFTTAMSDPWSHADFTQRYLQIRQDYPTIYENIIKYGTTLINFRDSRIALYEGIKDDLNRLYSLNSDFNDVLASFRTRVDQFYESVATLNNLITNEINGLLVSANCRTLSDQIKVTYNVFCINFMSEIAMIALCVLGLLICIFFAIIVGSIFGVRHANIQMLKRINNEHQEVNSSTSRDHSKMKQDKQIMFSEQSHSSEDDDQKIDTQKKL